MLPERIEWAIDVLEQVKVMHKPFDINDWFRSNYNDCNTAACALGWLCRDPRFKAVGLAPAGALYKVPTIQIGKSEWHGLGAGATVLGIPYQRAVWLFSSIGYSTRFVTLAMVVERLKIMLEMSEAELSARCLPMHAWSDEEEAMHTNISLYRIKTWVE